MKRHIFILTSLLAAILFSSCQMPKPQLKLWYDKPASIWEEALPLGNGHLGAMVYGQPINEEIQLNEETVWGGSPHNNTNPLAAEHLDEIRKLIFEGKNAEAQELCGKYISAQSANGMPYQTIGSLKLDFSFPGIDENSYSDSTLIKNYRRELNLNTAVTSSSFKVGNVTYQREAFTSFTDSVLIMRLSADKKKQISFTATFDTPMRGTSLSVENGRLVLRGKGYDHEGIEGKVKFTCLAQIILTGKATVHINEGTESSKPSVSISNADEAYVLVSAGTNFIDYKSVSGDADAKASQRLSTVSAFASKPTTASYKKLREKHISTYSEWFDRVNLRLGINHQALLPTDKRVEQFAETYDPQLIELYFQFGRYLLISSSQPKGQAANLQGIWNRSPMAPWDGKYTSNINLEMNYWPAEITNLSEMYQPLEKLISEVAVSGRESAAMYGCRGWTLHHNTDIWRSTGAVDGPSYGIWPTCNAWLCSHLYEHWRFSGDEEFLQRVWPIIKGACEFYIDFLTPEPQNGWLVVAPSFSPENSPRVEGRRPFSVVAGTTMDNQLVHDLFAHTIEMSEFVNVDPLFVDTLRALYDKLAPMQIGSWGQLQEWMDDWDNPNDHHRHVSHLWGLYPGDQITSEGTPDLFKAARTSLEARGDASTGWSMGWKVCLWARLLDGDHAMKLIRDQIKPSIGMRGQSGGTYPNLFDAHPPFQIDGNFGCCAGIAEMLVQSHEGFIRLLPALPSEWKQGRVNGLRCRGGFEITDLRWKDGTIERCNIVSHVGGPLKVMMDGAILEIQTQKGEKVVVK
ncbi:MAG: glycoside hydrolase family 95 protein [Bacteroidaceae bacterium]|nr:glycoside hydrolase family 95 protein [Bacteroidaceae bacterium]